MFCFTTKCSDSFGIRSFDEPWTAHRMLRPSRACCLHHARLSSAHCRFRLWQATGIENIRRQHAHQKKQQQQQQHPESAAQLFYKQDFTCGSSDKRHCWEV